MLCCRWGWGRPCASLGNLHGATGEPLAFPGRVCSLWGRGGRVTPLYLRALRGPGDMGWQRGRGNSSAISFHKLKLVLIS